MSQVCKICSKNERLLIDRALVSGKAKSRIAQEFGVTVDSLSYHAEHHLSHQLVAAYEKKSALEGMNLLSEIEDLLSRVKKILTIAEKKEQHTLALGAIREARGVFELLSRIAFSLHEVRLVELALERERDGTAERERQEEYDGRLAILTNAEFDLYGQLIEKVNNQTSYLVKLDQFLPDDPPKWVSPKDLWSEESTRDKREPAEDGLDTEDFEPKNEHPPIKMRRTKKP